MPDKIIKHTPGPWRIADSGTEIIGGTSNWEGQSGVELFIADCRVSRSHRTHEESEANAKLIAAAPDLLEAVKALCAWHDHEALTGLPDKEPVSKWAPSFDETVKMVHAAIARVEGRENEMVNGELSDLHRTVIAKAEGQS